jgi:hypothetical protein
MSGAGERTALEETGARLGEMLRRALVDRLADRSTDRLAAGLAGRPARGSGDRHPADMDGRPTEGSALADGEGGEIGQRGSGR